MITITPVAAKQIRESAKQGHMEGLPLRIAATRQSDGSIHYAMGFDDSGRENDMTIQCEGIDVVVSPLSSELLQGTTLDYVELEPGRVEFIFLNPNDPNYIPPKE